MQRVFNLTLPIEEWGREEGIDETHLRERIEKAADEMMAAKAANMGPELMRFIEKSLLIQTLDAVWKEHLYALDHLRQGIGLRAYGQRDPLNEYKSEAFALFNAMLDELKERVTTLLARVELAPERPVESLFAPPPPAIRVIESHPEPMSEIATDVAVLDDRPPGISLRRCRHGPPRSTRTTRRHGPQPRAMLNAPAGPARNTSIVMAGWPEHVMPRRITAGILPGPRVAPGSLMAMTGAADSMGARRANPA